MVYRHHIHDLRAWRGVLWAPTWRHEAIQGVKWGQDEQSCIKCDTLLQEPQEKVDSDGG